MTHFLGDPNLLDRCLQPNNHLSPALLVSNLSVLNTKARRMPLNINSLTTSDPSWLQPANPGFKSAAETTLLATTPPKLPESSREVTGQMVRPVVSCGFCAARFDRLDLILVSGNLFHLAPSSFTNARR